MAAVYSKRADLGHLAMSTIGSAWRYLWSTLNTLFRGSDMGFWLRNRSGIVPGYTTLEVPSGTHHLVSRGGGETSSSCYWQLSDWHGMTGCTLKLPGMI